MFLSFIFLEASGLIKKKKETANGPGIINEKDWNCSRQESFTIIFFWMTFRSRRWKEWFYGGSYNNFFIYNNYLYFQETETFLFPFLKERKGLKAQRKGNFGLLVRFPVKETEMGHALEEKKGIVGGLMIPTALRAVPPTILPSFS